MAKDAATIALSYSNIVRVIGRVTHNVECVIWDGGATEADYPGFLTAEAPCEAISSDAADKVGGGGATHIIVVGQGDNGVEITEEKALNGVVAVDLVNSYKIIYKVYVSQTENYSPLTGPNTGLITVRKKVGPVNMAKIVATFGESFSMVYRVPANYYGELLGHVVGASASSLVKIQYRSAITSPWRTWAVYESDYSSAISDNTGQPLFLPAGTDVIAVVIPSAAAAISGSIAIRLHSLTDGSRF